MFGNLDIKLGAENKSFKNKSQFADNLEAYESVVAAAENLERASIKLDALNRTTENMERGQQLAASVAEATGDNSVAVAVGRESLRMSLSMIGQGHLADEAYAGAENLTAGAEGASDFFKGAWEKTKEVAKKVWAWISELVTKVVNWVLDIFGRKEDSAEQLIELLKKLKEKDKTKLEATEFSKDVQLRLAKEIPLLAAKKATSSTDYEAFIDETAKLVTTDTDIKVARDLDGIKTEINNLLSKITEKGSKAAESKYDKKTDEVGLAFINEVEKLVGSKKGFTKATEDKDDQVEDLVGDFDRANAVLVGMTPEKKTFLVVGLSENGAESLKNIYDDEIDGEEIKDWKQYTGQFAKVVNGLFVKTVTIKIDDISDATDNADAITPLDYSECKSIAKKLKDTNKTLEKAIKTFNKDIETRRKNYEKAVEDLNKLYKDTDNKALNNSIKQVYLKGLERINGFITTAAKAQATTMADTAKGIVRSKFSHVITESTKLFIKR